MISSLHIKLARTALGITQEQVAEKSSVSLPTIKKIETTNPNDEIKSNRSTMIALIKFFEDQGVQFIDEKDVVGVRVGKKVIKQRFK
jgi:transcriptional regulator with XRE-family HTH domain